MNDTYLNSPIIKCDTVVTFKRAKIRNKADFSAVNLYDFTINQHSHFPNPTQVRRRMGTNGTGLSQLPAHYLRNTNCYLRMFIDSREARTQMTTGGSSGYRGDGRCWTVEYG